MIIKTITILVLGAALAAVIWSFMASDVEQAKYVVAEQQGMIELRDYAPHIVAQVQVSGEQLQAIQEGFGMIADFIFGNNAPAQKIAMTAPVIQQTGEKIAMTAPVIQQAKDHDWIVRFVMPSAYTMATLPKPKNEQVTLNEIPEKRFAVIRFSGMADQQSLQKHEAELKAFVTERKLSVLSPLAYAFYNPPWTLPFMRRNEVMVEIAK